MIRGKVVGNVWSTRRLEQVPTGAFLEVEVLGSRERVVAFDVLGCGLGEEVLIATGSVASSWFGESKPPIDALIVGSIDVVQGKGKEAGLSPNRIGRRDVQYRHRHD